MITSLVLKDILVMRKNITYYFGFLLVYGALAAAGTMPYSVLAGLVAMLGLMLPMSSFAFDDQARWEKFAVSTPAGRRGVVAAKYAFALLGTFSAAAVVAPVLTALAFLGRIEVEVWWEPLAVVGACICVTLFINSLVMPFLLKYGTEKTRILTMIIFGLGFGGMAALAALTEKGVFNLSLPPLVVQLLPALLVAVTVVALVISYAVAQGIYGKKEL